MLVAEYHMPLYIDTSPNGTITPSKCFLLRKLLSYPEYKSAAIQLAHHEQNGAVDFYGLYTFAIEVQELSYEQHLDVTG